MTVSSVIVAAGQGKRFGGKKQFEKINDKIVLDYSVEVLRKFSSEIIIVTDKNDNDFIRKRYNDVRIAFGGKERMDSVFNGLSKIRECDIVIIHDAARPCIEARYVKELIDSAKLFKAAILAYPATDTLKQVKDNFITNSIDRTIIYAAQTPQAFNYKMLLKAYSKALKNDKIYTDESSVWEEFYGKVKIVKGDGKNIKITTKDDLEIVKCLLG